MNATKRLKTYGPFAFVLLLAAALPASARIQESYGYLRVLEGSADVVQAGSRDDRGNSSAEINQPVLAGDRLRLADRSRAEVVLADRSLLRVDGGSELVFDRLANSPDTSDRRTVLRLLEGNLQLVVTTDAQGDDLPRIETPNATVTIENPGVYRITAERDGWTQLVVRRGSAQVESEDGAARVRAGDELVVEDGQRHRPEAQEAEGFDSLERWAGRLDSEYGDYDDDRYIQDDGLRYAARPLSRYGSWITYESRSYWRPRGIAADWRPYWQGRWAYTPSGLTWVSYEPWGWVPYHYGSWDYIPTYGWVWQAGYDYAPAHVYWYWGSDYVGWCPTGYYTRYYGHSFGHGFRFGVYGWANAGWGHYQHWNFVRPEHFGGRDQHRYAVPVDRFGRNGDGRESPGRGIITTDTRPLKPELWRKPQEAVRTLSGWRGVDEGGRAVGGKGPRELPDVTSFIARKPQLSPTEVRNIAADRDSNSLDGMMVKPIPTGRSPIEIGGGGSRWSQPGNQGGQGREERQAGQTGMRPQGAEKPAPQGGGTGRKPTATMEPGDSDGRWSTPGRKPSAERPAPNPETTGTWRDRQPREVEVPRTDRPRQPQTETPSWRKPATQEKPAPSGEVPERSWRNEERNREGAGESGVRPETRVRPKPESSGDSDGGSGYRNDRNDRSNERSRPSNDRPTYERPAPSREPSPEPSRPAYRPSDRPSSGYSGSSEGGSSGGSAPRERTVQPKPSESPRPQAAPRESGSRGNNNDGGGRGGGSKERPRERKPPAESDGDNG